MNGTLNIEAPPETQRINVTLSRSLVRKLTRTAEILDQSRSEFVADLISRSYERFVLEVEQERERRRLVEEDDDRIGRYRPRW